VKSHSAVGVRTSATRPLKPINSTFSATHPAPSLSSTAAGLTAVLRELKPRFLEGLTPPALKSVLAAAKYVRSLPDSVITTQDHPGDHLFLVLSGRARYFFVTEKGQKVILLWIPPGEIFGLMALLATPSEYLVSTEAVRNSSMLVWDRATIRSLAAQYPRLFENALSLLGHYLVAYRAAHVSLICGTARERLAHVLVSLASGIGHKVEGGIELKVRNEELANEANVTLFTASRLLSQWQRGGMLLKSRGKILLRSPELLLRHAA